MSASPRITGSAPGAGSIGVVSRALKTFAAAAGLAAALGGCRPAGVIFEPLAGGPAWPEPPDEPRIRYVGQLRSDQDLKPAQSPLQGMGELLFGREPARSMLSPIAVCTDGSRVFVADSNAQLLHVFDLQTRRYEQWRPPAGEGGFSQPVAVAYDATHGGRVLVSDSVASVVYVFDSTGACAGSFGAGSLRRPCGVAVHRADGRILVADSVLHQVIIFSASGEEIGHVGERGAGLGEFNFPTNVALDSRGRLYVSDTLNFRVQVFTPEFTPLAQIGRKGDMPGYFSQPKGLALDAEDHLYVVDANFEAVQMFTPEGQLLMSFGREGTGPGQFWLPNGICTDPAGRVWVADPYNRRVQVFQYLAGGQTP